MRKQLEAKKWQNEWDLVFVAPGGLTVALRHK